MSVDPPNPASDAFHAALGSAEAGRAALPASGEVARYLAPDVFSADAAPAVGAA